MCTVPVFPVKGHSALVLGRDITRVGHAHVAADEHHVASTDEPDAGAIMARGLEGVGMRIT